MVWNRIVTRQLLLLMVLAPACGAEPASAPVSVGAELAAGLPAPSRGQIREFQIPTFPQGPVFPQQIVTGPDGQLWFTTGFAYLARMSPETHTTSLVPVPTTAFRIVVGPDRHLWFGTGTGVARLSPRTGDVVQIPIPALGFFADLAAGPDDAVWVLGAESLVRVAIDGSTTVFPIPDEFGSSGDRLVAGPDGNLWFSRGADSAPSFYRVTRRGVITAFPVATQGGIEGLAVGPDRAIWYTQGGGLPGENAIGRIAMDGVTSTVVQLPDSDTTQPDPPSNMPIAITAGPDGKMYFTTYFVQPLNYIGQVTPREALTTFDIPTSGAASFGITPGPDGNIWFTENFNARIGRLILGCEAGGPGH
ncbi:MAG TPA: hypothetical protein VHG72_10065 [Polyangia bacterium]|nr:hypothetical protein [Polyangia bacterium]